MTQSASRPASITLQYLDPNQNFDGNPYECAGRSVTQTIGLVRMLRRALADTNVQARNAHMQRGLIQHDDPDADGYDATAVALMLLRLNDEAAKMERRLHALHRAVAYDPTAPLPKA